MNDSIEKKRFDHTVDKRIDPAWTKDLTVCSLVGKKAKIGLCVEYGRPASEETMIASRGVWANAHEKMVYKTGIQHARAFGGKVFPM